MTLSVLIADSSARARASLIGALPSDWNIALSEACDGAEALEAYHEGRAAVMFLDMTIPGMTALDVMAELERKHASTTVIVVAGEAEATEISRMKAGGAVAFLEKPIRRETLEPVLVGCGLYEQ